PICNRRQRAGVTALGRYLPHHILACPRLAPRVGKAEEGERGTIRLRMVSPIWPVVAEVNEARLVEMECESISCKSLTQNITRGVLLERRSTVISPAASRSRSTRRLASRPTPFFPRLPLGNGNVRLLAFQDLCSSSIQTKAFSVLVALAASIAHHSGTLTNGSTFLRFTGAAACNFARRF